MSNYNGRSRCARRMSACAIMLAVCVCAPAIAERIDPPLEWMHAPVNHLVVGTLAEINPAGRLVFKNVNALESGSPVAVVDVGVPAATLAAVRTGRRYIFAYTDLRADPRKPVSMVRTAGGATMLVGPGLEPALFRDTPATRALLTAKIDDDRDDQVGDADRGLDGDDGDLDRARHTAGRDNDLNEGEHAGRLVKRLLDALQGNDAALQNLAAAEIAYDPEVGEQLGKPHDRAIIAKVSAGSKTPSKVRVTLLRAAANDEPRFGERWRNAAVAVVTTTPVGGYAKEAAGTDDLVLTALELLDKAAVTVPPSALKRWLWSPNAALAERASLMLRRVSPTTQRTAIQQALADPKLPAATRKFLGDHLRRMDRIDAKSKTQNEGTG